MNKIKILASQLVEMNVPFYYDKGIIIVFTSEMRTAVEWSVWQIGRDLFVYGDFSYNESDDAEKVDIDELINRLRLFYA